MWNEQNWNVAKYRDTPLKYFYLMNRETGAISTTRTRLLTPLKHSTSHLRMNNFNTTEEKKNVQIIKKKVSERNDATLITIINNVLNKSFQFAMVCVSARYSLMTNTLSTIWWSFNDGRAYAATAINYTLPSAGTHTQFNHGKGT